MIGSIPEKVTYIFSSMRKIDGEEVCPAFISDSNNKKTLKTGFNWAEWKSYYQTEKVETSTIEVENIPVQSVQILSLEKRGRGGRAYKVLVEVANTKFYVDLREDILLDTLKEAGISKNGYLNGKYIWARVDSDMKLIREGSKLHEEMKESTRLNSVKISKSKLEIGGIYENKHRTMCYLGEYATIDCSIQELFKEKIEKIWCSGYFGNRERYFNHEFKIVEKVQLWIPIHAHSGFADYLYNSKEKYKLFTLLNSEKDISLLTLEECIKKLSSNDFEIVKSKTVKTKIGQVEIPSDLLEILRKRGEHLRTTGLKHEAERPKDDTLGNFPIRPLAACSKLEHLTKIGSKLEIKSPYSPYMTEDFKNKIEEHNSK